MNSNESIFTRYEAFMLDQPEIREVGLNAYFSALHPKWFEVKLEDRINLIRRLINQIEFINFYKNKPGYTELDAMDTLTGFWVNKMNDESHSDVETNKMKSQLIAACAYLSLAFNQKDFTFPISSQRIQYYQDRFMLLADGRKRKKIHTIQKKLGVEPLGSEQLNPNKDEFTRRDFKDIARDIMNSASAGVDLFDVVVAYAYDYNKIYPAKLTFAKDILSIGMLQLFKTWFGED